MEVHGINEGFMGFVPIFKSASLAITPSPDVCYETRLTARCTEEVTGAKCCGVYERRLREREVRYEARLEGRVSAVTRKSTANHSGG